MVTHGGVDAVFYETDVEPQIVCDADEGMITVAWVAEALAGLTNVPVNRGHLGMAIGL